MVPLAVSTLAARGTIVSWETVCRNSQRVPIDDFNVVH